MRTNSITKFLILAALSLLITENTLAQRVRQGTKTDLTARWQTYQICDDSVYARLPAAPTEKVETKGNPDGTLVTLATNSTGAGNSIYIVSCIDGLSSRAEKMTTFEQMLFFSVLMENYTKTISAKMGTGGRTPRVSLLPVRSAKLGGLDGFERDFAIGATKGKARMVFYGRRSVWSIMMTVDGVTPAREKAAFFDLMQINDPDLEAMSDMRE